MQDSGRGVWSQDLTLIASVTHPTPKVSHINDFLIPT